jgi:hypothetical protein
MECPECHRPLEADGETCLNVNCSRAQEQATRAASRQTAKAGAVAAATSPRAFTSSGRVD